MMQWPENIHNAIADWTTLLGSERVIWREQTMQSYFPNIPDHLPSNLIAILHVPDENLVMQTIRIADQYNISVQPMSARSRLSLPNSVSDEPFVLVDLSDLA